MHVCFRIIVGGKTKYLQIENDGVQDVVYKLSNRRNGKYELSMKMRMHGSGYFNIQADEDQRVPKGLFRVYFYNDGRYQVATNGGKASAKYQYQKDDWLEVKITADFRRNSFKVTVDGREFQLVSVRNFTSLGAINFYAQKHANFQVDDIILRKCQ